MIHAEIVRDFAIVIHIEGRDVGEFANFEGTDARMSPESVGAVDCGSGDCLGRRHSQRGAGDRKNHLHVRRGACSGIEICGERYGGAGINERTRWCVALKPEVKGTSGEQRARDFGIGERANVAGVHFIEMVGARGLKADGKARGARASELIGVKPRREAADEAGHENARGLMNRKRAAIAEDIAKLREAGLSDVGNPNARDEVHEIFRAALVFGRNDVRSEKRGGDVEALLETQLADDLEGFDLA